MRAHPAAVLIGSRWVGRSKGGKSTGGSAIGKVVGKVVGGNEQWQRARKMGKVGGKRVEGLRDK